jgi:phage recombination protein Bet
MEQKQEMAILETHDKSLAITEEMKDVIKSVIFPESTDAELQLFIYTCQIKGVHPLSKMIHPIKRGGKVSFQASIDYLRSESESAGDYLGVKQPEYEYKQDGTLESATVTVIRDINGRPTEFTATAFWDEYLPPHPNDFMWKKMPKHMLGKCAEALARRLAWPKKFNNLYTPEEMLQSEVDPKQKSKDRSSSVRPAGAPAAQQGAVIDAETTTSNPLDDEIMQLLGYLYKGDWQQMDAGLKEASKYKNKDTKKEHSFGLDRLSQVSADWKMKTVLPRLKKWKIEKEALEAEIAEGSKEQPAPTGEEEPQLPID